MDGLSAEGILHDDDLVFQGLTVGPKASSGVTRMLDCPERMNRCLAWCWRLPRVRRKRGKLLCDFLGSRVMRLKGLIFLGFFLLLSPLFLLDLRAADSFSKR